MTLARIHVTIKLQIRERENKMTLTEETLINNRANLYHVITNCDQYDLKKGYVHTPTKLWLNSVEFWSVVEESMHERITKKTIDN